MARRSNKRVVLFSTVLMPILMASSVNAQNADEKKEVKKVSKKTEKIEITGSKIKKIDQEGISPVSTFDKKQIEKSGALTVADFLRGSAPSVSLSTENATLTQSKGTATFSGRGFGSSYTLVLLNGRRLPANGIGGEVDLNQIPMAAVEKVEYLADGASALYGADAVAGVVNIITKKEYNGMSVTYQTGVAQNRQGFEQGYQVTAGSSTDKTRVLVAYDYFKREHMKAKDRPYIKSAISPDDLDDRSPIGLPGHVIYGKTRTQEPMKDCKTPRKDGRCSFDIGPLYEVQPFSERQSAFGFFEHDINDDLRAFGEIRYSRALTHTRNGAAPGAVVLKAKSTDADMRSYADTLGKTQQERDKIYNEIKNNKPDFGYEPRPNGTITVVRRYLDFGPRSEKGVNDTFALTGGLKGNIGSHEWEFAMGRANLRNLQYGVGGMVNSDAASAAFNAGILDPFIENEFDTETKQLAKEQISTETFRLGESFLRTYDLSFTGPTPLSLPGGDITYASGLSGRIEEYRDSSDYHSSNGKILGGAGGNGAGKRESRSVFGELNLPVVEGGEVTLAARHDDYYSHGKKTTYKVAGKYAPIKELLFRTSYGTGFKVADLNTVFLANSFGVSTFIDTTLCAKAESDPKFEAYCSPNQYPTLTKGNLNLKPESSKSYNFGIASQVSSFGVSMDYWAIEVKDQIGVLGAQELINNESDYAGKTDETGQDLITRDSGGTLVEGVVVAQVQNIAKARSAGIEFGADWASKFDFGALGVALKLSKLTEIKRQTSKLQPLCDTAKYQKNPDGSMTGSWDNGTYNASLTMKYNASYRSFDGGYTNRTCDWEYPETEYVVKAYHDYNTQVGYKAPWGTQLALGINNLLDAKPAVDQNIGWPWYSQSSYRNVGRFMYVKMTQNF